jgi:hypothetical protein
MKPATGFSLSLGYVGSLSGDSQRYPRIAVATLLVATLLAASGCSHKTGEPTEAEMRQAIQDRIDMVNENIAKMRNTQLDKNNPMSAIFAMAGAAIGDTRYVIGDFHKLSAQKAQDKPGYMCDYMLQLRATGRSAGLMDSIMKWGGEVCTARFVKSGDHWVWIPPGDER